MILQLMLMAIKENVQREYVVKKSQEIFKKQSFQDIAIDDIAISCNINKALIYNHFNSTEQIFIAVLKKELSNFNLEVSKEVDSSVCFKDKCIVFLYECSLMFLNFYIEYNRTPNEQLEKLTRSLIIAEIIQYEKDYFKSILEQGIETGELKIINKNNLESYSLYLISLILNSSLDTIENKGLFHYEDLMNTIKDFVYKTIE